MMMSLPHGTMVTLAEANQISPATTVFVVQDTLLALGLNDINDWLKAAERP
jgi:hypothetical protein